MVLGFYYAIDMENLAHCFQVKSKCSIINFFLVFPFRLLPPPSSFLSSLLSSSLLPCFSSPSSSMSPRPLHPSFLISIPCLSVIPHLGVFKHPHRLCHSPPCLHLPYLPGGAEGDTLSLQSEMGPPCRVAAKPGRVQWPALPFGVTCRVCWRGVALLHRESERRRCSQGTRSRWSHWLAPWKEKIWSTLAFIFLKSIDLTET